MPKLTNLTNDDFAIGVLAEAKTIANNEKIRKQPPTKQQIRLCIKLLRDFYIHIKEDDIPEFTSVQEMELWKRKMIHNKLYKNDK